MIHVPSAFDQIKEYFSPKVIGEVNDVYIKLAKIKGDDIPWHNHADEDELFFIVDGELLFEQKGLEAFVMKKGDMHIVGKGIDHRVSSETECHILLVEQKTTKHTGDILSEITKNIEEQLR